MTIQGARSQPPVCAPYASVLQSVQITASDPQPGPVLFDCLSPCDPSHLLVFASEPTGFETICHAATETFPGVQVTGCTTAGQIGTRGYEEDDAVVIALPRARFETRTVRITLDELDDNQALIDRLVQERTRLAAAHPDKPQGFAFLLVDGLSLREDFLTAAIAPAMGSQPLFGGSSGDGTRFEQTYLGIGDEIGTDMALLTFVVTDCNAHVFSLNHLQPTDRKMVVTSADPEQRIVKEINAEPAAREYARIVNKDPDQLDEFTFSAFPVVVQLGDTHHVRSIQRVNEDGELVFFAAIDEGMVLTIATAQDIADHLDQELSTLLAGRPEAQILAFDCVLRRIEATQTQSQRAVSDVLSRNRVLGFSTYGEQIGPLHVNHTMTGVVLTPPDS
ncbi:MAG: FIST signal transduction protein [Paracoccaceae bacterium]